MADNLSTYVIYYKPSDFPGDFVVREHYIMPGKVIPSGRCFIASTLEMARAWVPEGLVRIPRSEHDPKAIVESYI